MRGDSTQFIPGTLSSAPELFLGECILPQGTYLHAGDSPMCTPIPNSRLIHPTLPDPPTHSRSNSLRPRIPTPETCRSPLSSVF